MIRVALGDEAYTTAWEAGRALPLEGAIAEALAVVEELNSFSLGGSGAPEVDGAP